MYASILAHLQSLVGNEVDQADSALSLAMAMSLSSRVAVRCFVIPLQERPSANQRINGPPLQMVTDVFGVLFTVRVLNDTDGERAGEKLVLARDAVRHKLFGWLPTGASQVCELGAGDLLKMEPGQIWWLDRYNTGHLAIANQP